MIKKKAAVESIRDHQEVEVVLVHHPLRFQQEVVVVVHLRCSREVVVVDSEQQLRHRQLRQLPLSLPW